MPRAASTPAASVTRPRKGRVSASVGAERSKKGPREYTAAEREAIHAEVCELIATGMPSRAACRRVGVDRGLWSSWLVRDLVDGSRYAQAREAAADVLAESVVATAIRMSREDPQAARVVVDAKKWVAARMFPKRWGDRVDVTSGGEAIQPAGVVVLPVVQLPAPGAMAAAMAPPVATVAAAPAPPAPLAALKASLPTGL